MTTSPQTTSTTTGFEVHAARGPFNAAFFSLIGPYIEWSAPRHKRRVFADLPRTVVELGSGVGANLRYLSTGSTLVAVEPNPPMHGRLRAAAERRGVHLDLRDRVAERTGLPDHSVDTVISSLVLCTVSDPAEVLAEVRRILQPGGTYRFVEHVAAKAGTPTCHRDHRRGPVGRDQAVLGNRDDSESDSGRTSTPSRAEAHSGHRGPGGRHPVSVNQVSIAAPMSRSSAG